MRVKTELWIRAYVRQRQSAGAFAAVVAHGHDDAGAILIKIARLDDFAALFGPAPVGFSAAGRGDGERRFVRLHAPLWLPEADIDQTITQQRSYDSDLWVIEVEDRTGASGLDDWLDTPED